MGKALILSLLLGGCAAARVPIDNPRGVWCDHNQPRRDVTADTPRGELDEINTHNAMVFNGADGKHDRHSQALR